LDEQLRIIREQREELHRKETEVIASMFRVDIENNLCVICSMLEASVRQVFDLPELKKDEEILPTSVGNDKIAIEHVGESSEGMHTDDEMDILILVDDEARNNGILLWLGKCQYI
jgi:hypothetical protein